MHLFRVLTYRAAEPSCHVGDCLFEERIEPMQCLGLKADQFIKLFGRQSVEPFDVPARHDVHLEWPA